MLQKIKQLKGVNRLTTSNLKYINGGSKVCTNGEGDCPDAHDTSYVNQPGTPFLS